MEPIRINVEVSLSEATLEALKAMTNSIAAAVICHADPKEVHNFCEAITGGEPEAKAQKAEAPAKPEKDCRIVESSTAKEAPAPGPAPEPETESAQAETSVVSDEDLMNAVKTARRERGVTPAAIKALFKEYGIGCSKDCPESKRSELMSKIQNLTA